MTITCPTCDGTGRFYATKFSGYHSECRECAGEGRIEIDPDDNDDNTWDGGWQ